MLDHSSLKEKQDHANQLEGMTSAEIDNVLPVPLALDSGLIIPPVHLINLPHVKSFDLSSPSLMLQATKSKSMKLKARAMKSSRPSSTEIESDDEIDDIKPSPFIVSAFRRSNVSLGKNRKNKDGGKADFFWVENEKCAVRMTLDNPLPIDLKVSKLALMTEGVEFTPEPLDVLLAPLSSANVVLTGIPKSAGDLKVIGYTMVVLGVSSNCRLRNMPAPVGGLNRSALEVTVIPALPLLEVVATHAGSQGDDISCYPESLDSGNSNLIKCLKINMYAGEKQEVKLRLRNISNLPVEVICSAMEVPSTPGVMASTFSNELKQYIEWDPSKAVESSLPISSDAFVDAVLSLDANSAMFIGPPICE
jgi:hypothetical protein